MNHRTDTHRQYRCLSLVAAATLSLLWAPLAAEDFAIQLEQGLATAKAFEYGQDAQPLQALEQLVLHAGTDQEKRALAEGGILKSLEGATTAGSDFLCRLLRTIATERSIPALEALLLDPALSHRARYALEGLGSAEASAALRRAFAKARGDLRIGILGTLGRRSDTASLPIALDALRSGAPKLAAAAAVALGQIGGSEAIAGLTDARHDAIPMLRRPIDDALLACAERLVASGHLKEASEIYLDFDQEDRPTHHRIAALAGLIAAGDRHADTRILRALSENDHQLSAAALTLARDVPGEEMTLALTAFLPSLDVSLQEILIASLATRPHEVASLAVLTATRSAHESVRVAAYHALGERDDPALVDVLLKAAAGSASDREKQAARASLVRLGRASASGGTGVDDRLAADLGDAEANHQIERLRALSARQARTAFGATLALAWHEDETVREAAIRAAGKLARGDDLRSLIALTISPRDAADRAQAADAMRQVFRHMPDPRHRAGPLITSLTSASGEAKATLLELLVSTGTPEAMLALRRAVDDPDPRVHGTAVRGLAHWPDATPAEDLLTVAATLRDRAHKSEALKGYIRMASHSKDAAGMYRRAAELASTRDNTQALLEGLTAVSSGETLTLAEDYLESDDVEIKTAAGRSVVRIASGLRDTDPPRVKAVLARTLEAVEDSTVRREAQEVLNHYEQYEGYLLEWMVSGPYREAGQDSYFVYDKKFHPEQSGAQNVAWKPLRKGIGSWAIDLGKGVANLDHVAAYLRTRVHSPTAQAARLELGSDDAVKAWCNGELVHARHTKRGLRPRDDIVEVRLREGWNEILLKVVDHGGGWLFCCRLRAPDGTALEGLKVARH